MGHILWSSIHVSWVARSTWCVASPSLLLVGMYPPAAVGVPTAHSCHGETHAPAPYHQQLKGQQK